MIFIPITWKHYMLVTKLEDSPPSLNIFLFKWAHCKSSDYFSRNVSFWEDVRDPLLHVNDCLEHLFWLVPSLSGPAAQNKEHIWYHNEEPALKTIRINQLKPYTNLFISWGEDAGTQTKGNQTELGFFVDLNEMSLYRLPAFNSTS